MTLCYIRVIIIIIVFLHVGCIESHPESVKVTDGEWANFSCTINCSNTSLRWRLVSPRMGVVDSHFYTSRKLKQVWRKKEITIKRVPESENGDYESVMIRIRASSQMNGAVIQCGAIASGPNIIDLYSKFAVLRVEPAPEPESQESSGEDQTTEESMGNEETTRTTAPPTTPPPSH